MRQLDGVEADRSYARHERLTLLAAMIVLSVALNFVTLPFTQIVDPVRRTFGIDDVAFSMLAGVFFMVPSMAMSILGGWLADRISRRHLLLAAALLWTSGAIYSALAPSYQQLALARVIVAIGAGVKFPLAITWINDAFPPEQRGKAVGTFFVVLGLGPAIGASMSGLVLQAAEAGRFLSIPIIGGLEPWRAGLLLLALSNAVLVPGILFLPERRANGPVAADEVLARVPIPFGLFAALVIAAGLLSLGDTANLSWLPTVLRRQHHFTARQTGLAFGLIAMLAGLLGPVLGGFMGDAAHRRRGAAGRLILCAAAALACAPLLASYAGSSATLLLTALTISGVLTVLALSVGYVAIQAILPVGKRGVGTGIASASTQLLSAAAPTVVAWISVHLFQGPASLGRAVAYVTAFAFLSSGGTYAWVAWRVRRAER